jgi:predicted ATPase
VIPLLGRESEQAEIDRLLERVRDGLSAVLVIRGEAGISKTCLLGAVASSAHRKLDISSRHELANVVPVD